MRTHRLAPRRTARARSRVWNRRSRPHSIILPMTGTSKLSEILVDLAVQLPFAIAVVGCMIVMIRRRQRHPKVAVWALIGLALILLHAITFTFIYALVPDLFIH